MRRVDLRPLLLLGFLIIVGGWLIMLGTRPGHAQGGQQAEADYIGADECASCHRSLARQHSTTAHARALVEVRGDDEAIKADFSKGEQERTVAFPDEDAPRPFTKEDITYVIGAGRYVERYVYRISRTRLAIFPAEWNVARQEWQPYPKAGNWPDDAAFDFVANCAGCHVTDLNAQRARWGDDGVQCEACHGPGSVHEELASEARSDPTEDQLKELRAAIVVSPDAQVCGQCHSQGVNEASGHPYPDNYRPGLNLLDAATFTLVKTDDPIHWWATGHARSNNMQFNEWLQSRHSRSLDTLRSSDKAAPACLECHSVDYQLASRMIARQQAGERPGAPPELPAVPTATSGVTCIGCHDPHDAAQADFILAASDAYALCTSCHRATDVTEGLHHPVKEMFEGGAVVKDIPGIPSAHFASEQGPRCQTCHMPRVPMSGNALVSHTLRPVFPGKTNGELPDSCSGCHSSLSPTDLQSLIDDIQAAVRGRITLAQTRLAFVTKPETGSDAADQYEQVVNALAFVQNDGSLGIHNYAYADALLTAAERSISQLSVPGARLQPTEAPAPTATPSELTIGIAARPQQSVRTGLRPMTILSIGFVLVVLLIGAFAFFRRARRRGA